MKADPGDCVTVLQRLNPGHAGDPRHLTAACCESCHQDAELGYDLGETEIDGVIAQVCCQVLRQWQERQAR